MSHDVPTTLHLPRPQQAAFMFIRQLHDCSPIQLASMSPLFHEYVCCVCSISMHPYKLFIHMIVSASLSSACCASFHAINWHPIFNPFCPTITAYAHFSHLVTHTPCFAPSLVATNQQTTFLFLFLKVNEVNFRALHLLLFFLHVVMSLHLV